jgi:hypothetical protein
MCCFHSNLTDFRLPIAMRSTQAKYQWHDQSSVASDFFTTGAEDRCVQRKVYSALPFKGRWAQLRIIGIGRKSKRKTRFVTGSKP